MPSNSDNRRTPNADAELRSDNIAASAPLHSGLPMVLILGDSISIGYTPEVRAQLDKIANVLRPNMNCQHTGVGLAMLETWLGGTPWDVVHFNFGIWDTHLLDSQGNLLLDKDGMGADGGDARIRHTPEQYGANLERIVARLQASCRTLIWASTTPIMYRRGERFAAIPTLNRVAAEIMRRHNITINDLYASVMPHAAQWLSADQCHFNETGNRHLGAQVAHAIAAALGTSLPLR